MKHKHPEQFPRLTLLFLRAELLSKQTALYNIKRARSCGSPLTALFIVLTSKAYPQMQILVKIRHVGKKRKYLIFQIFLLSVLPYIIRSTGRFT